MGKGRLEAFSDGVIAIIITIMVLELAPPHGATLDDLRGLAPVFVSYVLSFANVGIYWNNHHHLFQAVRAVNGSVLWANLFLLFWLSPDAVRDGLDGRERVRLGPGGALRRDPAPGRDRLLHPGSDAAPRASRRARGWPRPSGRTPRARSRRSIYAAAIPIAFVAPWLSFAMYVAVAVIWFVPDRRIERVIGR